ncbi:MAG: NIL domain-containing protein [Ferrimicrobium sp.]|uniref:NIL domain-containing protein n=1 Tax=Ferrimicrobium acidiphilum TaxID=121039 RepID=A0ABV3Y206_9ACTN|nr:NIL domain-containing protein [Ferrimicrobium sp.]MCL5972986.1 NIL domain-containing protein [Actinomycetota bacterium]
MKAIVKLWYEGALIGEPVLTELVRRFDLVANINRANVEDDLGWIICTLEADRATVERATEWLTTIGVEVEIIGADGGPSGVERAD